MLFKPLFCPSIKPMSLECIVTTLEPKVIVVNTVKTVEKKLDDIMATMTNTTVAVVIYFV
jgi:hypothetical protein